MAIVNQDLVALRAALRIIDDQRSAQRERVREAVKTSSVPMPLEVVEVLSHLNPSDALDVLHDHPGYSVWERRRSYETSLSVFEESIAGILRAIGQFEEASRDGTIFNRTRERELNQIQRNIQKELFAATNAAHALVDHSTHRFQKSIQVPNYNKRRVECFKDDGLHDFVMGLRNILHHIHMVQPGYHVRHCFDDKNHEAGFELDKDELSVVVQRKKNTMNQAGQRYLENAPKRIDLRQIFEEYRERSTQFHSWFSSAIEEQPIETLRDYERCVQENRNAATRTWWKTMLGNWLRWDQPPNPFDYLDRYLTADQLKVVCQLPAGSKAQADKVIEFIDSEGACDGELRNLTRQLFRCAKP